MKLFVTGTDTAVGKTHVTAALVRELRASGRSARAIKPIETGWDEATSDAARLATASETTLGETVWARFSVPRSPAAAAHHEDRVIDTEALVGWCRSTSGDPVFIEGAGGWAVPIAGRFRMSDLAAATAAALIVVARAVLGTVNHTILTVEAARVAMPIHQIILSCHPGDDLEFARENAAQIAAQTGLEPRLFPHDLPQILASF